MSPSLEQCAVLADVLQRADYREASVLRRLDLKTLPPLRQRMEALPLSSRRTREGTPLDLLIRLFLLRQEVSAEAVAALLQPIALEAWLEMGLLRRHGERMQAIVELCPYENLVLAGDWQDDAETVAEPVMALGASSRALASFMIYRRGSRTLDLGTGCGVLAFLAATNGSEAVGVDCNPRTLPFVRLNASLNGVSNIDWRVGDLFEPVVGETFDAIVCNPPFVIGPGGGHRHTQGGRPADQLCQDIVQAAPAYLKEGGFCQVLCNWAIFPGQQWQERPAAWIAGTGCDAWVLLSHTEEAATYALRRVRESITDPARVAEAFDAWLAYFEKERIEAVGFGLLTLRRTSRPTTWFRASKLPEMVGPCGAAIERGFQLRDFLEANRDDAALLQERVRLADGVRWSQEHDVSSVGIKPLSSRLHLTDGLCHAGEADPRVVGCVSHWWECRTLGEELASLARETKQKVWLLQPSFLKVVRGMVEAGLLVPVKARNDKS